MYCIDSFLRETKKEKAGQGQGQGEDGVEEEEERVPFLQLP